MKRILLIDDDTDDQELFQFALDALGLGAELIHAADGETALSLILQDQQAIFHAIFLDLNMPRMGGPEFLQELRSRALHSQVPVYIYTTSAAGTDVNRCRELGATLFTKHSSFQELCRDLSRVLS